MTETIADVGEKRLLAELILPLLNPTRNPFLPGDDCGVVDVPDGYCVCASTDRVPWDLRAFELKLISIRELGYYLAVLNLSDIAAMGATAAGLLLNVALPSTFAVADLTELIGGVVEAAERYCCPILGGDLSDSTEPSLSATSLGLAPRGRLIYRRGAVAGDRLFLSGSCGLTATAFEYFLYAERAGMRLPDQDRNILLDQFRRPIPQLDLGAQLAATGGRVTAMDNTDGVGQSLSELAVASGCRLVIDETALPIHPISRAVAEFREKSPLEVVLGPGADFNLVGTTAYRDTSSIAGISLIGEVEDGAGVAVRYSDGHHERFHPVGWNYFQSRGAA